MAAEASAPLSTEAARREVRVRGAGCESPSAGGSKSGGRSGLGTC